MEADNVAKLLGNEKHDDEKELVLTKWDDFKDDMTTTYMKSLLNAYDGIVMEESKESDLICQLDKQLELYAKSKEFGHDDKQRKKEFDRIFNEFISPLSKEYKMENLTERVDQNWP